MSKATEAVQFLVDDAKKAVRQYERAEDPYRSLLQRESKTFDELMEVFDTSEDVEERVSEYGGGLGRARPGYMRLYGSRLAFLAASRKDLTEDYSPEFADVYHMSLLSVPYRDSEYALKWSLEDFSGKGLQ